MKNEFEVTWEAEDGYVRASSPHSFYISDEELDSSMDENDLETLFFDNLQDEFENHVRPATDDLEEFLDWAKERVESFKAEEE